MGLRLHQQPCSHKKQSRPRHRRLSALWQRVPFYSSPGLAAPLYGRRGRANPGSCVPLLRGPPAAVPSSTAARQSAVHPLPPDSPYYFRVRRSLSHHPTTTRTTSATGFIAVVAAAAFGPAITPASDPAGRLPISRPLPVVERQVRLRRRRGRGAGGGGHWWGSSRVSAANRLDIGGRCGGPAPAVEALAKKSLSRQPPPSFVTFKPVTNGIWRHLF